MFRKLNEQVIQGKKEIERVELNLYLTLTVHNQTAIYPPPQVFMTCKPETVNYEDKKYDKLHEVDSYFFFQGYKLTLYFHFSDQKVETTLILSEKECNNPGRQIYFFGP